MFGDPTRPPGRRRLSRAGRITLIAASAGFAVLVSEGLCRWAHGNAFPYLNIFEPDARYGVVLEPNTETRVRTRRGRVSTVRTNELGFRGSPTLRPRGGVLLLGDSQVLGFGVEVSETVAGRLRAMGHATVAAGVPSWGPPELALAAEEWVPRLGPEVVVFFANLANDWPEAQVANVHRHTARDGWLVRQTAKEADTGAVPLPGRRWLLGRSQLVFTVRALAALSGSAWGRAPSLGAPAAEQMLGLVHELAAPTRGDRSRITSLVRRTVEACRDHCRVIVAILPMDVQVDDREWAKYGRPARDLSRLAPLSDGLRQDLSLMNVAVIDLLPVLRAASPGAFLDDDPHLSPRGHRAIAEALRPRLEDRARITLQEVTP